MPPTVQNKSTSNDKIKLHLARLKQKALNTKTTTTKKRKNNNERTTPLIVTLTKMVLRVSYNDFNT